MRRERWATSLTLGVGLCAVFFVNRREIGAGDTVPATLMPIAIWRSDGLALNRFAAVMWPTGLPWYVAEKHGQIVSRYPLAPGVLAVPLVAPQIMVLDRVRPGWEQTSPYVYAAFMAKNAAALCAALTGVVIYQLLRQLGLHRVALLATLIATLGSTLWVLASQALWQHAPAALALSLTVALLLRTDAGPLRLFTAGVAAAVVVAVRPQNLALVLPVAAWVAWRYRRAALWFLPAPLVLGAAVVGANYWYFGTASGGYREIEPLALPSHNIAGYWTTDIVGGAAGTLFSPSRGLFVFSPWTALALASLPATYARIAARPLLRVVLWSLVPFFLMLSSYAAWWGGWSWGPRYCTDALPVFAVMLAFALDWSRKRCRPMFAALVVTGVFSVAIEMIGAFYFPSTWNAQPADINLAHERLWDWSDTELSRCLREGPKKPYWLTSP